MLSVRVLRMKWLYKSTCFDSRYAKPIKVEDYCTTQSLSPYTQCHAQTHSHARTLPYSHAIQHKTRALVLTTKGTQHLAGEIRSASDLDFYVDGVSHLAAVSG